MPDPPPSAPLALEMSPSFYSLSLGNVFLYDLYDITTDGKFHASSTCEIKDRFYSSPSIGSN